MFAWLDHLRRRWNDWCGDRDMEVAIRKHLTSNGYHGGMAKLRNVRLVAVQRPGWLQVFRFEATARVATSEADDGESAEGRSGAEPEYHQLYGLVRDDIRHKISVIRVFQSTEERSELFARWSDGLICLRGAHGLGIHQNATS